MKISKDEFNINYMDDEWFYGALKEIAGVLSHRYTTTDMEDWKQEAISRCFRKRHLYKPETGKAFSYFFRIMNMEFNYRLREEKRKYVRVTSFTETLTDDDKPEDWIKIDNRWWSAEELTLMHREEGSRLKFIKRIRRESNVE